MLNRLRVITKKLTVLSRPNVHELLRESATKYLRRYGRLSKDFLNKILYIDILTHASVKYLCRSDYHK